mmetsp:Transcript_43135/g.125605  ORF Transcript_43135/g.125605 Transcript_43135/m.125605 type:complete len:203 (-) Transcript_43135:2881-3489(-)
MPCRSSCCSRKPPLRSGRRHCSNGSMRPRARRNGWSRLKSRGRPWRRRLRSYAAQTSCSTARSPPSQPSRRTPSPCKSKSATARQRFKNQKAAWGRRTRRSPACANSWSRSASPPRRRSGGQRRPARPRSVSCRACEATSTSCQSICVGRKQPARRRSAAATRRSNFRRSTTPPWKRPNRRQQTSKASRRSSLAWSTPGMPP